MQARSRPLPPQLVDLDVFLHEGTAAPARATQSLRWLTKQARVDLGLSMLVPPAGQARRAGPRGQAAVVEPVMLCCMEAFFATSISLGQRCGRSPCRRSTRTAARGSSGGAKASTFACLGSCRPCCRRVGLVGGLASRLRPGAGEAEGGLWTSDVYRMAQREFADLVENPAMISLYSFRRVGTTVGQLVGFSALDMAALGDWRRYPGGCAHAVALQRGQVCGVPVGQA